MNIRDAIYGPQHRGIYGPEILAQGNPNPPGWNSTDPIFDQLIRIVRPQVIVEVGSWLGASAIHMAKRCCAAGLKTQIVCVDTWVGSLEMWLDKSDETRFKALRIDASGRPNIYYDFLDNVHAAGFADMITPFPVPSTLAAQFFRAKNLHADLVYIDASHEEPDVLRDIQEWLPSTRHTIFGDDYLTWMGVRNAVNRLNWDPKSGVYNTLRVDGNHWAFTP